MLIRRSNPLKMTSNEAKIEARAKANSQERLRRADALIEKDLTRRQRNLNAGLGFTGNVLVGSLLAAVSTLPAPLVQESAQVSQQTNQAPLINTQPNTIEFGNPSSNPRSQANLFAQAPELPFNQKLIPPQEEVARSTTIQTEPLAVRTSSMPVIRPGNNSSMPNARASN